MDKKNLIYLSLVSLLMLPSCSQEDPAGRELPKDSNLIYFRSYLPTITRTRASEITTGNFNTCQVTCFNPDDPDLIDSSTDTISTYFRDICFEKDEMNRFFPQGDKKYIWPDNKSRLHFFAYYPSVSSMRTSPEDSDFSLVNNSKLTDGVAILDYRLKNFRVARDIADQVDFVTAYASGTLLEQNDSGIELNFKHPLTRVELSAWSEGDKYDFEIAGVRLGNPIVTGDFDFSALTVTEGQPVFWSNESQDCVEHIYSAGESVVKIGPSAEGYKSSQDAASIMGSTGAAMLIPMSTKIEAWEGKNDPDITTSDYSTDKMYFSILIRVKNTEGEVVYPYPNDRDNMTVIYLAVDAVGKVSKRLNKIGDSYYTVEDNSLYIPSGSEEICGFGWAALPVAAKWEAGKIYSYKLNYSEGIGWHDPDDPKPGDPIIERGKIPFEVNVEEWVPASSEEYTPDLTVPKR